MQQDPARYLPLLVERELRRIGADVALLGGLAMSNEAAATDFLRWLRTIEGGVGHEAFMGRLERLHDGDRPGLLPSDAPEAAGVDAFVDKEIDVYGRRLILEWTGGTWRAYDQGADGKRQPSRDLLIPDFVRTDDELAQYLADALHERARPDNRTIRWIR
jgi:hypothetical protein